MEKNYSVDLGERSNKQLSIRIVRSCAMNNEYRAEVFERWSTTFAYREHKQKTKNYSKEKWTGANDGLMLIFSEFARCRVNDVSADSAKVQTLVAELKVHITTYYYTCANEILAGLGEMYVADERFKNNIDKYGKGTAEFASKAIAIFCQEKWHDKRINTRSNIFGTEIRKCNNRGQAGRYRFA